jgi:hypothetical protein
MKKKHLCINGILHGYFFELQQLPTAKQEQQDAWISFENPNERSKHPKTKLKF